MSNFHKTTIILPVIYFLIISAILIWNGTWFSPDRFFGFALLAALFLGRSKQFIRDWSVPIILLVSYDYLRGLVPQLTQSVNIHQMIDFDRALFGSLPTNYLQSVFYSQGNLNWYDYVGTVFYMSHFISPMVFGFIFWISDKGTFRKYFLALLVLSYWAFFTYIIFPAMPPWMAAEQGFIPEVFKVMDKVWVNFGSGIDLPSIYKFVGANLVAAVPSLHAAYPLLTMLFLVKKYKSWGLLILPYLLGVWFSIVYLGEHYVFDIVIAVAYSCIVYIFIIRINLLLGLLRNFKWHSLLTTKEKLKERLAEENA